MKAFLDGWKGLARYGRMDEWVGGEDGTVMDTDSWTDACLQMEVYAWMHTHVCM